jgi:translation initiation factor 3 subunit F
MQVSDCFGVPHQEKAEEVLISKDYHKNMYNAHKRIYRSENIVGWYTTTSQNGAFIVDNSSLIHEFYCGECDNDPIHIVVDTTLSGDTVGIRAFVSQPLAVGPISFANMFQEIKVELNMTDAEISCLHHMIHGQVTPTPWEDSKSPSAIASGKESLQQSVDKLHAVIEKVINHIICMRIFYLIYLFSFF